MMQEKYDRDPWIHPVVELRPSPIHGRGMFAKSPLKTGEVVVVWAGNFVTREDAERARVQGRIVMQLDDDLYSIEERGSDDTYFMNHSCDPNVWMSGAVTLVACHDIVPGEELTVDYALFEADESFVAAWACACRSAKCRSLISGVDWTNPGLQEWYKGHFSPLINKRIAGLNQG